MYFIVMAILGLILLVCLGLYIASRKEADGGDPDAKFIRAASFGVGIGVVVLMGVLTVAMSFTAVSARSVTIVTTFGTNPVVLQPGPHWTPPWSDKESFTTLNQTVDLNDTDGTGGNSVYVTFSAPEDKSNPDAQQQAGGGNGNINAVVTLHVDERGQGATLLWTKYQTQERAYNELVRPAAQDSVSSVANDYTAGIASVSQDLIGSKVKDDLSGKLKPYGIVVDNVSIKRVVLDEKTQASLQKIVDSINTGRQYEQEKANSAIQNEILEERKAAGALTREANERYCLDLVRSWSAAEQGPMPVTFNCFGQASSGVIVNAPSK